MRRARAFFEMPPIIGDFNSRHRRGVELLSVQSNREVSQNELDSGKLDKPVEFALRMNLSGSCQFYEAAQNRSRFPEAILTIEFYTHSGNVKQLIVIRLQNITITSYTQYQGDVVVGLEFKKTQVIIPGIIPGIVTGFVKDIFSWVPFRTL